MLARCGEWRVALYVARIDASDWCMARPALRRGATLLGDAVLASVLLAVAYCVSLALGLLTSAALAPRLEQRGDTLWLHTPALGFFVLLLGWCATLLCSGVYHDVAVAVK